MDFWDSYGIGQYETPKDTDSRTHYRQKRKRQNGTPVMSTLRAL